MNLFSLSLTALKRDWRSGELRLIAIAVIIAVASLTSVGFFTDRVRQATELQATELLAADLVLLSTRPIDLKIINTAHKHHLMTTRTTSFRSIVVAGNNFQMTEVKAIENGYPIRGKLRISNTLFGKEKITTEQPNPGNVWVDARLLQLLGISLGEEITLGESRFKVNRVLTYEPDRSGDLFNIAPRLLMHMTDLPATGLVLPGSRVRYRLLVGGETKSVINFRQTIVDLNQENLKIQGIRDARPELKTALQRAEQFLGLAALVSIALAGLAVALSAQRYAVRHFDNCAIMRCLGAEQHIIVKLYLIQLIILSLMSSLLGCAIGYLAQEGLTALMSGLTKGVLPAPSLLPVMSGLFAGVITVLGFAMPQIFRLHAVTPLRVLRRDLTPLPPQGLTTYVIAVFALALLAPWQSGKIDLSLYTFTGLLLTALVLTLSSKLIIGSINYLRSRVGVAFRYGLANVARRANQSTAQILGIGLGVMIMLLLTLIRTDLLETWHDQLPEGTPNYFLINIQPDEVDSLQSFLQRDTELTTAIYPMVRGRLVAINDKPVSPDTYKDSRAQRLTTREFNLSWAMTMQPGNRLVTGEWWSGNETDLLLSVEEGIAETLGIKIDDNLTYLVAGREVEGKVINIRWVEWDTFNVNFFVIANPGKLEEFPATYITSFYLPSTNKELLVEMVRAFPSITVFDIDTILSQVRNIMDQVVKAIEFVFGFTLLAGLVVMLAALQTTHDERTYESALMSALGANRNQILASLTAEFLCLGLIAGILSAFAATLLELILAQYIFQMSISINPWIWVIAPVICTIIIVVAGLAGTRHVFSTPPMIALRRG
jgi:putative ABC transport system permease protein